MQALKTQTTRAEYLEFDKFSAGKHTMDESHGLSK